MPTLEESQTGGIKCRIKSTVLAPELLDPCQSIQSCPTLCSPELSKELDCHSPGSSVHRILQEFWNSGMGRHALLQGIFPTQRSNPALLHCRWSLYHLSHQGSPCRSHRRLTLTHCLEEILGVYLYHDLLALRTFFPVIPVSQRQLSVKINLCSG